MKALVIACYWLYAAVLIVQGALGVVGAQVEAEFLFKLNFGLAIDPQAIHSLLNEYRFLRAVELGFGLMLVLVRRDVFEQRRMNAVFLLTLFCMPLGRVVSLFIDGLPNLTFLLFVLLEGLMLALFAVYFRGTVWSKRKPELDPPTPTAPPDLLPPAP